MTNQERQEIRMMSGSRFDILTLSETEMKERDEWDVDGKTGYKSGGETVAVLL